MTIQERLGGLFNQDTMQLPSVGIICAVSQADLNLQHNKTPLHSKHAIKPDERAGPKAAPIAIPSRSSSTRTAHAGVTSDAAIKLAEQGLGGGVALQELRKGIRAGKEKEVQHENVVHEADAAGHQPPAENSRTKIPAEANREPPTETVEHDAEETSDAKEALKDELKSMVRDMLAAEQESVSRAAAGAKEEVLVEVIRSKLMLEFKECEKQAEAASKKKEEEDERSLRADHLKRFRRIRAHEESTNKWADSVEDAAIAYYWRFDSCAWVFQSLWLLLDMIGISLMRAKGMVVVLRITSLLILCYWGAIVLFAGSDHLMGRAPFVKAFARRCKARWSRHAFAAVVAIIVLYQITPAIHRDAAQLAEQASKEVQPGSIQLQVRLVAMDQPVGPVGPVGS